MNNIAGSACEIRIEDGELKTCREIEKSIIKKFRKNTWSPFIKGIKEYDLIQDGDKIAVAISGGKDSLLLAKMFQELKRHGMKNFELVFIAMDPGYHEANRNLLMENCKHLDIPVHIYESSIFDIVDNIASDYPCYLCARMRRGSLYSEAEKLGCNKLALGHHYDDVIETVMMNVLCGGQFMTMMPKIKAKNFEKMELIRPMYYVREESVKAWAKSNSISALNCGCIVAAQKTSSKRREIKELIADLSKTFSNVEKSIFNSAKNVHLGAILGWKIDETHHNFLDHWDDTN